MLFLLPFTKEPSWGRFPYILFAIVLVNILVYIVFQFDDKHHQQEAVDIYFSSYLDH